MRLLDFKFSEYYHKYIVFEVDALTERCKEVIAVKEEDCFALCSNYIRQDGILAFPILSIGKSVEDCRRGLQKNQILGEFELEEIKDCSLTFVEATPRMVRKNEFVLKEEFSYTEEELFVLRKDARLDGVRQFHRPDFVRVGILDGTYLYEYFMRVEELEMPFINGKLVHVPKSDKYVYNNEHVKALPIFFAGAYHLLAVYVGEKMSKEEKEMVESIQKGMEEELGISYRTLKN